jgi:hypothetical protein
VHRDVLVDDVPHVVSAVSTAQARERAARVGRRGGL